MAEQNSNSRGGKDQQKALPPETIPKKVPENYVDEAERIMRSLKSLIGEISNYASCYHNKTPKTEKQKETYARYVDLLSITNGGFAVVKPRECLISSVA